MKIFKDKPFYSLLMFTLLFAYQLHAKQTDFRDFPSFSTVHASGSVDVILEKGESEMARVEVDNIDVSKIVTRVENGTLKIYVKDAQIFGTSGRKKVFVSYKNLHSIKSSGSGDVQCNSELSGATLQISSSGSGDVKIKAIKVKDEVQVTSRGSGDVYFNSINTSHFKGQLSGSGDLKIENGMAQEIAFSISGSGDISAGNFTGKNVQARTSGSGDIKTHASESINIKISGSGDVGYYGNPSTKNVNKSGSGDARKL